MQTMEETTGRSCEVYGDAVITVFDRMAPQAVDVCRDIANLHNALDDDDAFLLMDIGQVQRRYAEWTSALPGVEPFYAVKCNNDPVLLRVLAECGAGFDCASKNEIDQVLDAGLVTPDRIIYANPCKTRSYIRHAADRQVHMMTFDNEEELLKVGQLHPNAQMIVRIAVGDPTATCQLNVKFGCDPVTTAPRLLAIAAQLGVQVVGVSFHVGSGCNDPTAYAIAIAHAARLFTVGTQLGHHMTLLDLGGGFPGFDNNRISFRKIADVISVALDDFFPPSEGVRVIAEPGRFFAADAFVLATNIIAKTKVPASRITNDNADAHDDGYMYYMNDGVYGSFNCLLYDHGVVNGRPLFSRPEDECEEGKTAALLWGPTCDGLDLVQGDCRLRRLQVGDWLYFDHMGAYTCAAGSEFNGFPRPKRHYFADQLAWKTLMSRREQDNDDKQSIGSCETMSSGFSSDSDYN